MRRDKRNKKKKGIVLRRMILIALVITIIVVIANITNKDKLKGTWSTDGITIYQFNGNGEGYLLTSISKYNFIYKADGKKLHIDFKNDKAKDSNYEFNVKNNELNLKGIDGTTGEYKLYKKD